MDADESEEFDTPLTNPALPRSATTHTNEYGFQQARSVNIGEEHESKLDGIRPKGSRNHFQGNYYTTTNEAMQGTKGGGLAGFTGITDDYNDGSTVLHGSIKNTSPSVKGIKVVRTSGQNSPPIGS